ncbi:hypothetical protein HBDW_05140 [Herbaspirillum sp. DW155]|uniref:hypothetical protein n=1 Tax=Herbaspirillum sp. DW155 TaxID=3095609 RepID=UPI0030924004|nr:hypothetical protein HBDW_05140 [Herbaspirillum sp. DW155]
MNMSISSNSLYPTNNLHLNNGSSSNKSTAAGNIASANNNASGGVADSVSPATRSGSQGVNSVGGIINTSA